MKSFKENLILSDIILKPIYTDYTICLNRSVKDYKYEGRKRSMQPIIIQRYCTFNNIRHHSPETLLKIKKKYFTVINR